MTQTPATKKQRFSFLFKAGIFKADIFQRSRSTTLIIILFLVAMLPILIMATMTEVLNFSDARVPSSIPNTNKSVIVNYSDFTEVSCDNETCSDGYVTLKIVNLDTEHRYIDTSLFGQASEIQGINVELLNDDGTPLTTGTTAVLEPQQTVLANIRYTDDYVMASNTDPDFSPGLSVTAYDCTSYDESNHTAQDCLYLDQDSIKFFYPGYLYRANNYAPASLADNTSILMFSSMAVIDPDGRVIQPDPQEPPTITEEVIEPNFRTIITISWRDSLSLRPLELKLYMQERYKLWYMAQIEFIDTMVSDAPITIPVNSVFGLFDFVGADVRSELTATSFPTFFQDYNGHRVILHNLSFADGRSISTPPPARADLHSDGVVDIKDFSVLVADFGQTSQDDDYYIESDLILNNEVGIYDYNFMLEHMGKHIEYWD
ncbi:MAG: hypothetical protein WDZ94_04765 [Patescibacteria group bacterium]